MKEPDGDGKTGETVFWWNRKGMSTTNPYLDLDNTSGKGTEHYYAAKDTRTRYTDGTEAQGLYGDYKVRVHYYADHDDKPEATQRISWTVKWRYLAYCRAPCTQPENSGFWKEGSAGGSLSVANSSNCCDIGNASLGDWSQEIPINYPEPKPEEYVVLPTRRLMLP